MKPLSLYCTGAALISAFASYASYKLGYKISPALSSSYGRLSSDERKDWDSRYSSTIHAVVITGLVAYIFAATDFCDEDAEKGGPVMLRTSKLSEVALGVSLGYFIVDIGMVARHFPLMGGPAMLLHHAVALASVAAAAGQGQGHMHTLTLLATEVTTPFVNARWFLDKMKLRDSREYTVNGVALTLGWAVGRVALFVWFFARLWAQRSQLALVSWATCILVTGVPSVLFVLNLYWFSKIVRGALKLFTGRRHEITEVDDSGEFVVVAKKAAGPAQEVANGGGTVLNGHVARGRATHRAKVNGVKQQ